MTVLSYERGALSLAYLAQYDGYLADLIAGLLSALLLFGAA